jgi:hypothetical protein
MSRSKTQIPNDLALENPNPRFQIPSKRQNQANQKLQKESSSSAAGDLSVKSGDHRSAVLLEFGVLEIRLGFGNLELGI